jgi:hypothetical protein
MTSRNTIPTAEEDYLEVDDRIGGQNYVCISFVSPEDVLKQKEFYLYHRFMTQICGEVEFALDQKLKPPDGATEETKAEYAGINAKFVEATKTELRNFIRGSYDGFKSKYDDFRYKHGEKLDEEFSKDCNFKTNVRGVKVRGVFDTYGEAEKRAKRLQSRDRSFHVFVGQMGYWLPWDPCADKVANEEYLEEELNTLMKEYKSNEVRKDLFYEEQKREKQQDALKERLAAEEAKKKAETEVSLDNAEQVSQTVDSLETEDPWIKSKFTEAPASAEAAEAAGAAGADGDSGTPAVKEI